LWGTLAIEIITTHAGVQQYFEAVMSSITPFQVSFGDQCMRACGDLLLNAGSYTLSFVQDGQMHSIAARFSMTFRKTGGQWLIVDHHSSVQPTPLTAS
jgi:hypothetical protein